MFTILLNKSLSFIYQAEISTIQKKIKKKAYPTQNSLFVYLVNYTYTILVHIQ